MFNGLEKRGLAIGGRSTSPLPQFLGPACPVGGSEVITDLHICNLMSIPIPSDVSQSYSALRVTVRCPFE